MIRYGKITSKIKREIVLLKGYPCAWGRCSFCDYIHDNGTDEAELLSVNREVMNNITGEYSALEVINSGSVFELPKQTLCELKELAARKNIRRLFFESHYSYKERLNETRRLYNADVIFKCGIETFDNAFRNNVLKKGIVFDSPREVAQYFKSVCLLVGVTGQTKDMIRKDIEILLEYFSYGCVNLYIDNSTPIKADEALKEWFREEYSFLQQYPNIDVLCTNTDFGVGGDAI